MTGITEKDIRSILDFADMILLEKALEGRTVSVGKLGRVGLVISSCRMGKHYRIKFQPTAKYKQLKKALAKGVKL